MAAEVQASTADDEIDLKELFFALWAGKIWVSVSTVTCACLAIVYALSVTPEFEAKSVFELKSVGGGSNLPGQLDGLASLAGINFGGKSDGAVLDRLAGRDFVERLADDVALLDDPFYAPAEESDGFSLRGAIRGLLVGDADTSGSTKDVIDDVFEVYSKTVAVSATTNGSYEVVVTHVDPVRAAAIANAIVERLVSETSGEKRAEDLARLNYLSQQLAEAATLMEDTSQAVSEFALANSLSATGAFAQRSEEIYQLNEQRRRSLKMIAAVRDIVQLLQGTPTPDVGAYNVLKERNRIVDDVEFRRLLGVSESLTQWQWPRLERLMASLDVLDERVARSESRLVELNREAERYAKSSEQLMILKRDAAVAEATYQVLIEQVKAQSLVSGFEGETVRIYQSATPPAKASAPQKTLIVALGIVLGGFVGAAVALVRSMVSGRLHTRTAVSEAVQSNFEVSLRPLRKAKALAREDVQGVIDKISASVGYMDLDVAWKESASPIFMIGDFTNSHAGVHLGLALGEGRIGKKRNAVLLVGGSVPQGLDQRFAGSDATLVVYSWSEHLDVLHLPNESLRLIASALENLSKSSEYECVVAVVSGELVSTVGRVLPSEKTFVSVVTQPGITTRQELQRLTAAVKVGANVSIA